MARNPFQYLLPVAPEDFVGRRALVDKIISDLTLFNGDSHAIIAGRRCGKSSVINVLAHELGQSEIIESHDFRPLPLCFDFQSKRFQSVGAFFAHMLREVCRLIDGAVPHPSQTVLPSPIQLDEEWFQNLVDRDALASHQFEDALGYILDQLATPKQPARLVLLLDEMDETVDRHWTEDLYGQLRALVYSGKRNKQIRLVLAGSKRFLTTNERGSPLWNVLKLNYLYAFTEEETKRLTYRAEALSEDAKGSIWQQSGGHPFLAQYLLYYLWEEGAIHANAASVEQQATRFHFEQARDLEGWKTAIDIPGHQVYQIIASASDWMSEYDIAQAATCTMSEVKHGLVALCYHGLCVHDGLWRRYKRTGDLFKNWFEIPKASDTSVSDTLTPPIVFLSYSHKNENEKNHLVKHLRGLERRGLFELWFDDKIEGGADWEQKIKSAMAEASVSILLISADFLDSDFIVGHEVPGFLERRNVDGLTVFPIIATPCVWEIHDWLRQMNVRPKNGEPIWGANSSDRQIDATLTDIAKEIFDIIQT